MARSDGTTTAASLFPAVGALGGLGRIKDVLRPATYGCPDCGTMRMIASALPLGDCPDCGAPHQIHA